MSRVNHSGVRMEPELTSSHRDAFRLEMLEAWAGEGRYRKFRRRQLAIAVMRSNGWKYRQIAEVLGIHTCRAIHLFSDLKRSLGTLHDEPKRKG